MVAHRPKQRRALRVEDLARLATRRRRCARRARAPRRGRSRRGAGSRTRTRSCRRPRARSRPAASSRSGSVEMKHWRGEVLRRLERRGSGGVRPLLHVLVEALEPPTDPAASRLEEHHSQTPGCRSRMPAHVKLKHAICCSCGWRARVAVREVVEAVVARLHHVERRALVDRDRHIELGGRRPQRFVDRVVQRTAVDRVRPHHDPAEAEVVAPRGALPRPRHRRRAAGSWRCRRAVGGSVAQ